MTRDRCGGSYGYDAERHAQEEAASKRRPAPSNRQVKTYAHSIGVEIVVVPLNEKGMTDIAQLKANAEGFAGL